MSDQPGFYMRGITTEAIRQGDHDIYSSALRLRRVYADMEAMFLSIGCWL